MKHIGGNSWKQSQLAQIKNWCYNRHGNDLRMIRNVIDKMDIYIRV